MSADHAIFLRPGEIVIAELPSVVTTLLGSCVAVTLFNARLKLGAICHAVLPSCRREGVCDNCQEPGKYVPCAISSMLQAMAEHGVTRGEIEAKIFGGSDMFDSQGRSLSVGSQNAEMALRLVEKESLTLVTQDLGGRLGRKIVFHTATGEVLLKRLKKTELPS
jgi:chemotaxis protein CheD